ncbi:hypothetical protein [Sphingomonas sp.]|jgi:hypothetical protein|uniref:hypothetical protein n=1 Tax=Sphingomonas sp. TaxID=28214 RepID=UPI00356B297C
MQGRSIVVALVLLAVGFAAGFMLRPVLAPTRSAAMADGYAPAAAVPAPRGTQYFAANLDEARTIIAGCREGSVRGDECAHASEAVITADSRERTSKFIGSRPR